MATESSTQQNPSPNAASGAAGPAQATKLSLPSDREIVLSREFTASPERLFDAWTQSEHIPRWYGCEIMRFETCELDLRVGGQWRIALRDQTGTLHAFSGEYREIMRPNRLVFSERYEPIPGSDHVVTLTFERRAGKTHFSQHMSYPSKEARDGHLQSGMDRGAEETFARLDEAFSKPEA